MTAGAAAGRILVASAERLVKQFTLASAGPRIERRRSNNVEELGATKFGVCHNSAALILALRTGQSITCGHQRSESQREEENQAHGLCKRIDESGKDMKMCEVLCQISCECSSGWLLRLCKEYCWGLSLVTVLVMTLKWIPMHRCFELFIDCLLLTLHLFGKKGKQAERSGRCWWNKAEEGKGWMNAFVLMVIENTRAFVRNESNGDSLYISKLHTILNSLKRHSHSPRSAPSLAVHSPRFFSTQFSQSLINNSSWHPLTDWNQALFEQLRFCVQSAAETVTMAAAKHSNAAKRTGSLYIYVICERERQSVCEGEVERFIGCKRKRDDITWKPSPMKCFLCAKTA